MKKNYIQPEAELLALMSNAYMLPKSDGEPITDPDEILIKERLVNEEGWRYGTGIDSEHGLW